MSQGGVCKPVATLLPRFRQVFMPGEWHPGRHAGALCLPPLIFTLTEGKGLAEPPINTERAAGARGRTPGALGRFPALAPASG